MGWLEGIGYAFRSVRIRGRPAAAVRASPARSGPRTPHRALPWPSASLPFDAPPA